MTASPARPPYSVALPPSRDIVEYARLAAGLGYERVWVYDSPALYGDVWVALARIAEAVPDIALSTGVAVPSLRHPMVTASAIGCVEELAPGRLSAYFGTGFTARVAMGQRGMRWADLATYFRQVRALLAGEVVDVDGAPCQLIHSPGWGPPRPITVTLGLAPIGPKGFATSRELTDSVVLALEPAPEQMSGWRRAALLVQGSVLDAGEDHTSRRLLEAVGPVYLAPFHALSEWAPDMVEAAPGGADWLANLKAERPEHERHLAVHEGHFVYITDRDRPLVEGAGEALLGAGWTGDAASVAARFDAAGARGVTEVVYGPSGPDIPRELEAFAAAAQLPAP